MFHSLVFLAAIACLLRIDLEVVQASPLNLHTQLQAALQQVVNLKGNGNSKDCCDVSMKF